MTQAMVARACGWLQGRFPGLGFIAALGILLTLAAAMEQATVNEFLARHMGPRLNHTIDIPEIARTASPVDDAAHARGELNQARAGPLACWRCN